MSKCQMCGAEVKIGQRCEYCGSIAEPCYYNFPSRLKEKIITGETRRQRSEKRHSREFTYTIEKGDCLWNIAKRFYGDGLGYKRIVKANPQIKNPNSIYLGQTIIIPK